MPDKVNFQGHAYPSVEVAQRAIDQKHSIAKSRMLPMKLTVVENLKKEKVHIFNVGPWPQPVNTGSFGTYMIPGCPWDKEYVELLVMNAETGEMEPPISVIMEEYVIKSEDEMSSLTEDGWNFAQQIVGIGRGCKPHNKLTKFGIFASQNAKPTKEEKIAAKAALIEECKSLVKWAADTFVINRDLFSKAVRPDVHFVAARVLGVDNPQDSPWMLAAEPKKKNRCKMCGRTVDSDVATCEAGHVVNMELYLELQAADEQLKAAIAARK